MSKTKLIILSHWLEIGGAERSLIGFLRSIDYDRFDVDLFLCRHSGELMGMIPPEVNLLPEDEQTASVAKPFRFLLSDVFRYRNVITARLTAKLKSRLFDMRDKSGKDPMTETFYVYSGLYRSVAPIGGGKKYDCAVSYLTPHHLALHKVDAKKKFAWIHTDYSNVAIDVKREYEMWSRFDHIISISDSCTASFLKIFPSLEPKIRLMENIVHPEAIRDEAEKISAEEVGAEIGKTENETVICTVGRFSPPKNMEAIPEICFHLKKNGCGNVKWMIIGFGGLEEQVRENIRKFGVEDNVRLLGKKVNPYPYIKACDIYVQPSKYEGKAVSVREAQILGRPVVITDYETAASQITDMEDGLIAPMSAEGCAEKILLLIKDKELREKLRENCMKNDYGNLDAIRVFYDLCNEDAAPAAGAVE